MNKSQLQWYLRQLPRYGGLLALVGLGLLVLSGILYLQKLQPAQLSLQTRELDLERQFNRLRSMPVASAAAPALGEMLLNQPETYTFFLRRLNHLNEQYRIVPVQMDYKTSLEQDGHFVRYSIQFGATTTYMQLDLWARTLEAIPGVRIESINLSRSQIGDEQLTAQIQLSYLTEVR
ncbi:hypothetical protein [Chitinilyticum piscinae]|uniref:Uncharacterized protein n=1 Tax=Chitinilyticum piscinae TaxID=2866724 RepID=A0A8J7FTQ9_9NEIS|nr:hypothetical protein [Chitinilyticum piscinae]MBE9610401.1 hypothetical protein [Chitinilyticum piscinae]